MIGEDELEYRTICVKELIFRLCDFRVALPKLKYSGQKGISSALDVGQDIVERIFKLETAC